MGKTRSRHLRYRAPPAAAVLVLAGMRMSTVVAAFGITGARICGPELSSAPAWHRALAPLASFRGTANRRRELVVQHMSDVNGGVGDGGGGGGGKGGKGDGWLDRGEESDQLREVRELISEQSLPVSFGIEGERNGESPSADDPSEEERPDGDEEESAEAPANGTGAVSAGLARPDGGSSQGSGLDLKDNPYLDVVSRLSPSDLISKFTSSAHPRVQDAVRSTILGLIGNLPKMAFDTTTVTTGERLASLMFQLQMTGYMFKNAEYRLSLAQSIGMDKAPSMEGSAGKGFLLNGDHFQDEGEEDGIKLDGNIQGTIRVKYRRGMVVAADDDEMEEEEMEEEPEDELLAELREMREADGMEIEVDAAAYMSELRDEVKRLKEELQETRKAKDETVKNDLLLYIRTMPREELTSLTGTVSPEVLNAMKGLVNVVMSGIGEGRIEAETVTEQSGEAMAQLCMWQLVVGYNLRELEVREEMQAALGGSSDEENEKRTWYGSG